MGGPVKDYAVQIRVKNNWFLTKMREVGFESVAALSRFCGISQSTIGKLVNLQRAPTNLRDAEWRGVVVRLSEALRCMPEDLFPPQHVRAPLKKSTATLELGAAEVQFLLPAETDYLPDVTLEREEAADQIAEALSRLPIREAKIIRERFGFDGERKTLEEIGNEFGLSKDRIRQLEESALRRLRKAKTLTYRCSDGVFN